VTAGPTAVTVLAPAKLTLSLRVVGVRPDGYHELDAEMVALDLADELTIDPAGHGLTVAFKGPATGLSTGPENLVTRALEAVGRRAAVHLVKRIPVQGGLGGGSADAAAVLRWAGCDDPEVAAALGADVPFCVVGGRARVTGVGERVEPMPFEDRSFILLVPPFGVDTAAVYRAFDASGPAPGTGNDLEAAALVVQPELGRWRDRLAERTGALPRLAGSGSTWFVEGTPRQFGLEGVGGIEVDGRAGRMIGVRTVGPHRRGLPARA
jgi:4-diphosphocytidyl-2-C-methyl-D-erythritol kinase